MFNVPILHLNGYTIPIYIMTVEKKRVVKNVYYWIANFTFLQSEQIYFLHFFFY